ncbi:MAG: M23 family metallopeptidase [Leptospiraceae bacterium]|nr:M23 family metallopeptidase [Leptospiraceae bacterium]
MRKISFLLPIPLLLFYFLYPANSRARQNDPRTWVKVSEHTEVLTPPQYRPPKAEKRIYQEQEFKLVLYSRKFATGEMVYAEILPLEPEGKISEELRQKLRLNRLKYNGIEVKLVERPWGLRGLFAIYAHQKENGWLGWTYPLQQVSATGDATKFRSIRLKVDITKFPVYTSELKLGKYSNVQTYQKPEVLERIKKERTIKDRAFASREENHIQDKLAHPRDMHKITSPFYVTRVTHRYEIKNGKKIQHPPKRYVHKGLDLRGWVGHPVYAMAPAKVVLSREMFFEGGFVLLDHGNGIKTGYMHLSKLVLKDGQSVKAGQLIAEAGATGMVTAAHLHVSLWVNGYPIDPLSLLCLPVRW